MKLNRFFTALLSFVAAAVLFSAAGEAGKKKLYFGGPLGTFEAKRSPGSSSNSYKKRSYKSNKSKAAQARKARARAAAKAKARAKAEARRKAYAKAKAAEAAKRRARANSTSTPDHSVADTSESGPTESNTSVAPSTAAILTRNQLARQKDESETIEAKDTDGDSDNVTVAKSSETEAAPATNDSKASVDDTGCKRFIPEVGMTVSVDC